ncbi:MAG: pantoate--beta-alanine ligase [bacterium]
MKVFLDINDIKKHISELKQSNKIISLVPTMGNLHSGHISLVEKAKKESDVVIVSIFVNPIQFGPNEDFNKYPRTLEEDLEKIKKAGGDIIFTPSVETMYQADPNDRCVVSSSYKSRLLCGKFRPDHFDGVLTVVLKLLNICEPDKVFFGMKDYQQYILIKDMCESLNLNIDVVACPLIRDRDGLALSSRNAYMSAEQRTMALSLSKAINSIKNAFEKGEKKVKHLKGVGLNTMSASDVAVQYIEIVDSNSLMSAEEAKKGDLVAVAAYSGKTRLIDNIIL